jgi:hypothetical protein
MLTIGRVTIGVGPDAKPDGPVQVKVRVFPSGSDEPPAVQSYYGSTVGIAQNSLILTGIRDGYLLAKFITLPYQLQCCHQRCRPQTVAGWRCRRTPNSKRPLNRSIIIYLGTSRICFGQGQSKISSGMTALARSARLLEQPRTLIDWFRGVHEINNGPRSLVPLRGAQIVKPAGLISHSALIQYIGFAGGALRSQRMNRAKATRGNFSLFCVSGVLVIGAEASFGNLPESLQVRPTPHANAAHDTNSVRFPQCQISHID